MEQLELDFGEREKLKDTLQDLFAWINKVGVHLYGEDADEGRRLVDSLWEQVKK